jgi:hypothetical protein
LNFQISENVVIGNVGARHALPLQNYISELPIFTVFAEGTVRPLSKVETPVDKYKSFL